MCYWAECTESTTVKISTPNVCLCLHDVWLSIEPLVDGLPDEIWTPNEGIDQRYLNNYDNVADKICFGRAYDFGIGIEFWAVQ